MSFKTQVVSPAITTVQTSTDATIAAQAALAEEQNNVALNQAENSFAEELGKGVKALAQ